MTGCGGRSRLLPKMGQLPGVWGPQRKDGPGESRRSARIERSSAAVQPAAGVGWRRTANAAFRRLATDHAPEDGPFLPPWMTSSAGVDHPIVSASSSATPRRADR